MDQGQAYGYERENGGTHQQDPAGPEQDSQINRERSDEHDRDVESASDPGSVVKADSNVSLEIGQAK